MNKIQIPTKSNQNHHQQTFIVSKSVRRNSLIFAIAMLILQIVMSFIYSFKIGVPSQLINIGSIITTIGLAILVVAGFGLLFGYTGRLLWSSIGFSFFITALCIELYPLINSFWTRTGLQYKNTPLISFAQPKYNIFLSNRNTSSTSASYYGNCITNAIKCALSCSIAFSGILGRAGSLQCLIVTIFGTIGFQLNRQVIQQNQGSDTFGTFYIFTFGGFMSLLLGFWQFMRQTNFLINKTKNKQKIKFKKSIFKGIPNSRSVGRSIFGSLIIFAFFPFLAYQIDAYTLFHDYSLYINPLSLILAMGAGAMGAIISSLFINGEIIVRDVINGPIAGAIAVGASTLYITNPAYSLLTGLVGGLTQGCIQNLMQKRFIRAKAILTTVSWSLFGIQGIIGSLFAVIWKEVSYWNRNEMPTSDKVYNNFTSNFEAYAGLISAGIGAGFGLLAGLIIYFINTQESDEYFEDTIYWRKDDGVSKEQNNHRQYDSNDGSAESQKQFNNNQHGRRPSKRQIQNIQSSESKTSAAFKSIDKFMLFCDIQ